MQNILNTIDFKIYFKINVNTYTNFNLILYMTRLFIPF